MYNIKRPATVNVDAVPLDDLPWLSWEETSRRVCNSTVSYSALVNGEVSRDHLQRCLDANNGCRAVLVALDSAASQELYDEFYSLQFSVSCGGADPARFDSLDVPVAEHLSAVGVHIWRILSSTRTAMDLSYAREQFQRQGDVPSQPFTFASSLGRPILVFRKEFHCAVNYLKRREAEGTLQRNSSLLRWGEYHELLMQQVRSRQGLQPMTGVPLDTMDEAGMLDAFRDLERRTGGDTQKTQCEGDGGRSNGFVYYGAFRGRRHQDRGGGCTVLFGPGEVRRGDFTSPAYPSTSQKTAGDSAELVGTLALQVEVQCGDETSGCSALLRLPHHFFTYAPGKDAKIVNYREVSGLEEDIAITCRLEADRYDNTRRVAIANVGDSSDDDDAFGIAADDGDAPQLALARKWRPLFRNWNPAVMDATIQKFNVEGYTTEAQMKSDFTTRAAFQEFCFRISVPQKSRSRRRYEPPLHHNTIVRPNR